jgi:hypothetical protein
MLPLADAGVCRRATDVRIHVRFVSQRDRHIGHDAIAHGDRLRLSRAVMFSSLPENAGHVDSGGFHFQAECSGAAFVDDGDRRAGVDHQGSLLIVNER